MEYDNINISNVEDIREPRNKERLLQKEFKDKVR